MEEELCGNNWDLDAVVRLGCCRRRISPAAVAQQVDPFASFLQQGVAMEVAAEKEVGVEAAWSFPELTVRDGGGGGLGRDADELLKAFCAAFPSSSSSKSSPLPTTPLRTPSMEEDEEEEEEEELLVEDMEMAGEDELLFLNGGDDNAALDGTPMSSLFDIADEPFLPSPWTEPTAAGS